MYVITPNKLTTSLLLPSIINALNGCEAFLYMYGHMKGSVEKGDKCFLPTLKVKGQPYGKEFSESIKAGS